MLKLVSTATAGVSMQEWVRGQGPGAGGEAGGGSGHPHAFADDASYPSLGGGSTGTADYPSLTSSAGTAARVVLRVMYLILFRPALWFMLCCL